MQMIGIGDKLVYDPTIDNLWDIGMFGLRPVSRVLYSGPALESYQVKTFSPGVTLTWNFANDYAYSPSNQLVADEAQTFRFMKYPWKNQNQSARMKLILPYGDMVQKTVSITAGSTYTVPEKTSDPLFWGLAFVTVRDGATVFTEVETTGALVPGSFHRNASTGVISFQAADVGKNLNINYSYTVKRFV